MLGEVLSAVLLNPNPDKAKIYNQSTQFTTYHFRRPAQLLPNSPHSQALKPSGTLTNLSAETEALYVAFFLECFYLFPLYIETMTDFGRKADTNKE